MAVSEDPRGRAATAPPVVRRWPIVVGLVLLAFNLRPAVTSIGPVLDELRASLGVSNSWAGLLTTLPLLCFVAFGGLAPLAARRVAPRALAIGLLALLAGGLLVRAITGSPAVFLAMSAVALAGIAVANVVLPVLVKRYFVDHIGPMTAAYVTALALGSTAGAALSVPIADAASWRYGLGVWAAVAAVAMVPWVLWRPPPVAPAPEPHRARAAYAAVLHSRLAWAMTLYFGTQAVGAYVAFGWLADIYRDAGFSASTAGLLVTVYTAVAIPMSLVVPNVAARRHDQRGLVVFFAATYLAGFAGLLGAPHAGAWLWAVLLGIAGGSFPLALTLIGLRATTTRTTVALSALAQSGGYAVAAVGPLAVGVLHDLSGGWTVSLVFVIGLLALQLPAGLIAGRPVVPAGQRA